MATTPTPHNAAVEGQIAKTVLMPGDPLRAKLLADTYLENVEQFNTVRNMFGYTGTYKGQPVSVMGSGMGMPSIGIYSYELFNFYGVDNILRIGSAGGLAPEVKLRDIVIGMSSSTDSNYPSQYGMPGTIAPTADFGLLSKAVAGAEKLGYPVRVGNILASDVFYTVEMESAALYLNAMYAHKHALTLLTISDLPLTGEALTAEERQTSFTQMMEVALSVVA